MKALLKKVLPQSLMNKARGLRDVVQLGTVSSLSFEAANLSRTPDIYKLLTQEDAQQNWAEDHAQIMKVLIDEDRAGGVNPGDRRVLYMLLSALKPKTVLEIGTHIGASTLYIARALKAAAPESRITTVDICDVNAPDAPWKGAELAASPQENLKTLGCADMVDFVVQSSQSFMVSTDKRFDFIFLDGDHTAVSVYKELSLACKLLHPRGMILLHDYYPEGRSLFPDGNIITGPYQALERVKKENPDINVLPLGKLPWPTKQGSHMTSLALVIKA